ncbi:DsrH/TusB family sulfur relay protein [bacterium]|nr:DsrH/TusB family sulfur relay protein [bacterium]MBU1614538.1 DsrH/TusB family sulfur relay protein [bacterium]
MAVFLLDKPSGEIAAELTKLDPDPKIVLIKDGVYLDPDTLSGKIYAMEDDVEVRGLKDRLAGKAESINYSQLVDLIVENKVINFS